MHGSLAFARGFHSLGDFRFRGVHTHAVEKARIREAPETDISLPSDREVLSVFAFRNHDRQYGQSVLVGKFKIALVMRGTAENRAGAIGHQHEIRDIDGQRPIRVQRMRGG